MSTMKVSFLDNSDHPKFGVKVFLDNNHIGTLHTNEDLEISILPGKHEIYVSYMFFRSNKLSFKVEKENRQFEILGHPIQVSKIGDYVIRHEDILTLRQRMV
ncbi:MAG: hypothetical protein IKM20_01475 [Erysipelotrichales bacterium]|nr:hypothetical protein [Erysipelotrichales bacterium]